MPGPTDTGPCAVCGKLTTRQRRYFKHGGRRPHVCVACAIGQSVEAMDQLHRREGPAYDTWKAAMIETADRLRDSG
jgi:hypothetical protein